MNVVQLKPEPAFDDWWQLQHHKIGKVICQAKWNAITSEEGYHTRTLDKSTGEYFDIHLKASPQEIIEGQKRQNRAFYETHGYGKCEEQKYLRRPQQWLNQGGWLDE